MTSDVEVATVRGWTRADWGAEGETMAWCCTEEPEAYVGERPVVESLADELIAIVGEPVYVELRRRLVDSAAAASDPRGHRRGAALTAFVRERRLPYARAPLAVRVGTCRDVDAGPCRQRHRARSRRGCGSGRSRRT